MSPPVAAAVHAGPHAPPAHLIPGCVGANVRLGCVGLFARVLQLQLFLCHQQLWKRLLQCGKLFCMGDDRPDHAIVRWQPRQHAHEHRLAAQVVSCRDEVVFDLPDTSHVLGDALVLPFLQGCQLLVELKPGCVALLSVHLLEPLPRAVGVGAVLHHGLQGLVDVEHEERLSLGGVDSILGCFDRCPQSLEGKQGFHIFSPCSIIPGT